MRWKGERLSNASIRDDFPRPHLAPEGDVVALMASYGLSYGSSILNPAHPDSWAFCNLRRGKICSISEVHGS
jgi:hypothetical protein